MNGVIKFMQEGGIFMIPIALCMGTGVVIAIERFIFLTMAKAANRKAFDQMLPLIKKKDIDGLIKFANNSKTAVASIIGAGASRLKESQDRDDISMAMEECVMEATPRLEKRTGYLPTLANISTLLGLLGTVMGLIEAFAAVAHAEASEKSSLLTASIAVGMNCTAFGLLGAIPLVLAFSLLTTKTTEIVDSLEMAGVKFLNIISR